MNIHGCTNPECELCREDVASGNVWPDEPPPLTDLEKDLLRPLVVSILSASRRHRRPWWRERAQGDYISLQPRPIGRQRWL